MNIRRERALEAFLYITFPIALFIGCAGSSDFNTSSGFLDLLPEKLAFTALVNGNGDSGTNEGQFIASKLVQPTREQNIWSWFRTLNMTAEATVSNSDESLTPSEYVLRFAPSEFEIATEDLLVLRQHAQFLTRNPNLIVTITGFSKSNTEWEGGFGRHSNLAQQRAEQVFIALMVFGAPAEQLIVDSYGGAYSMENCVELLYSSIVIERENQ